MTRPSTIRTAALGLVAASMILSTNAARAEGAVAPQQASVSLSKSVAGMGEARFDWLENRGAKSGTRSGRTLRHATLGNGRWICSPAGFNRKSRCFKR